MFFVRHANIAVATSEHARWEAWDVEVQAMKAIHPHHIFHVWPFLELLRPGGLEQSARHVLSGE